MTNAAMKPVAACVAIVIVNYKTPDLVEDCLASVAAEQTADLRFKVYVGDADSQDGSVASISRYIAGNHLDFVSCFDIGVNGGFAYGNNYIVEHHVLGDPEIEFVYFLNPDTYVRPGAIAALVRVLQQHPQVGAAGSRLENPDGSPRSYGFRFPAPWREFFSGARLAAAERLVPSSTVKILNLEETREVDWVTGASFMMPKRVLERVGLMDPAYFLYFEEVDLMSRVRAAGYSIWHVAESRVVHLQGQATGVRADDAPKRVPAYWYKSRYKFLHDRYGKGGALLGNVLFLLGDLVYRLHRLARGKPILDAPFLWRDMFAHGFSLPTPVVAGRR
jgi:N-acetylglucosaminyl-diphospho-decaprenol L-rhamnosyltransferase